MTTPAPDIHIVPITHSVAEVKLNVRAASVSVGKVCLSNGLWYWQHRDGEQSSPIAPSRVEAANALAAYHRAFKPQPVATEPVRRLLFA
jgi:hypothetical protein